jgi:uncharacterized cupin superfamily protein
MMRVWQPSSKEIKESEQWNDWNKEVSEFPWFYSESETCYILEGEAIVSDNNGNQIRFRKGDMVHFEQGVECTWKIVSDIRKKYLFG